MILVTGGTGFIGRELVKRLLQNGKKVRVLSRKRVITLGDLVVGDITQPASLEAAMDGVDTVYHLAAIVDHFESRSLLEKVNVFGTQNVVEAALKHGVSRFIHCSTVSAEKGGGTTAYGKSKILAEAALQSFGTGLSYVVIRPGPVYDGERSNLNKTVSFAMKFKLVGKIVPDTVVHLASRKNVVDALLLAAGNGQIGKAYAICDQRPVKRSLLSQIISEKTRAFLIPIPFNILHPLLNAILGTVEIASTLVGSKPPLTRQYLNMFIRRREYNINPAVLDLGYRPEKTEVHFSEAVDVCLRSLSKRR